MRRVTGAAADCGTQYRRRVSDEAAPEAAGHPAGAARDLAGDPAGHLDVRQVRVRRAPRYGRFLGTGAVLGLLAALVGGLTGPGDPSVGRGALVGYLALAFGLLGALAGGATAVLIERFRP